MERPNRKTSVDNRQGEKGDVPERRQRVYMKSRQWYFASRDGQEHGPFVNLTEARRQLALYLRRSGVVRFSL